MERNPKPWDKPQRGGRGGGGGNQSQSTKRPKVIETGVVAAVPSGDRIVVYLDPPKNANGSPVSQPVPASTSGGTVFNAPRRKEIKLSWIKAPRPSILYFNEVTGEETYEAAEPFYWDSRDFLRKLAIGKQVLVETKGGGTGGRELGIVTVRGDKEDLSTQIVEAGLADVVTPLSLSGSGSNTTESDAGPSRGPVIPEKLQRLISIEREAKLKGIGKHTTSSKLRDLHSLEPTIDFDHWDTYVKWKGESAFQTSAPEKSTATPGAAPSSQTPAAAVPAAPRLKAVVEAVMSGSMVRATIIPTMEQILLRIAGVRSPLYKRGGDQNSDEGNVKSEPFGKEAQWTTERYTLHRDAEISLTGFDRDNQKKGSSEEGNFRGGVYYGELFIKDHSIGEILLSSGLATFVEWSAPKNKVEKYRALEFKAAEGKSKLWSLPNAARDLRLSEEEARAKFSEEYDDSDNNDANRNNSKNNNTNTNNNTNNNQPGSGNTKKKEATAGKGGVGVGVGGGRSVGRGGVSFNARVKSIMNGSNFVVDNLDLPGSNPETITLSSVLVPKFGREARRGDDEQSEREPDEPLAWDAREFVRKRIIGKKVKVTLDYIRPELESKGSNNPRGDPRRSDKIPAKPFYTVEHEQKNIALGLVENGLATVVTGSGDNRSPIYDSLLLAQDRAQKKGLGIHVKKNLTRRFVNDVSRDSKKSKALFSQLAGNNKSGMGGDNKYEAIVEYVISGNRLKVSIPKENVMLILVLDGVKTPALPRTVKDDGKDSGRKEFGPAPTIVGDMKVFPGEPLAQEALEFTRNFCHQMDVEVELDGQDKNGAFKGYLWKKKQNLGELLLMEGLARTVRTRPQFEDVFDRAMKGAQESRKGVWVDWDPVKEEEERRLREEALFASRGESSPTFEGASSNSPGSSASSGEVREAIKMIVHVTEVIDSTKFYCQIITSVESEQLTKMMESINKVDWNAAAVGGKSGHMPERGEIVLAQFSGDGNWYRGQVRSINETNRSVWVFYGDFGNNEYTTANYIRKMPEDFSVKKLKWQARECSLAYIQPSKSNTDLGEKAALKLKSLVWDKKLPATTEYTRPGQQKFQKVLYLNLWANDEQNTYVNGELVRKGLARVDKRLPRNAPEMLVKLLRDMEETAHENHKGIWQYGDPGEDEEVERGL